MIWPDAIAVLFPRCSGTIEEAEIYFLDLPPEFRESQQLRVQG